MEHVPVIVKTHRKAESEYILLKSKLDKFV